MHKVSPSERWYGSVERKQAGTHRHLISHRTDRVLKSRGRCVWKRSLATACAQKMMLEKSDVLGILCTDLCW